MTKYRILCIAILAIAPFAFLSIVGGYHLWISCWTFIAWWPMAASLTLASVSAGTGPDANRN